MKKQAIVYQIRNMITGYSYIGVTTNLKNRMANHRQRLARRSDYYMNPLLQEHYDKHGPASFELIVLDECDIDVMFKVEIAYIKHFAATSFVYNKAYAEDSSHYSQEIDDNLPFIAEHVLPFVVPI